MPLTPTDPTKPQIWITGEAPNQSLDFYIPQGPKGDPGGITLGTDIGTTTNLNDIRASGIYRISFTQAGLLLRNFPIDSDSGILHVYERTAGATPTLLQVWYSFNWRGRVTYQRGYDGVANVWTPWRAYNYTRVDQTAGRAIYQWDDINNREQLIYGDTGWRDVRTLGNATNFDFSTRIINLRREGNTVRLSGQLHVLAGVTAFSYSTFLAVPSGFRVAGGIPYMVGVEATALQVRTTTALLRLLTIGNDVALQTIPGTGGLGNMAAGDVVNLSASWSTMDAWPTTLPGTASGSIPNA